MEWLPQFLTRPECYLKHELYPANRTTTTILPQHWTCLSLLSTLMLKDGLCRGFKELKHGLVSLMWHWWWTTVMLGYLGFPGGLNSWWLCARMWWFRFRWVVIPGTWLMGLRDEVAVMQSGVIKFVRVHKFKLFLGLEFSCLQAAVCRCWLPFSWT